jgi:alpha,alpha-trehalase
VRGWLLRYEDYDPRQEGLREALTTVGNGYFASRGAAPESAAGGIHYPGTYVAGCYDRLLSRVAGRAVENEDLVNMPNWLPLSFRAGDGAWFDLDSVEILAYRQELDLRRGILTRRITWRDGQRRTSSMTERRFVHMGQPHLAGLQTVFTPEDWDGRLVVRSTLDGTVRNAGVARYRDLRGDHLEPLVAEEVDRETVLLQVRTGQSRIEVAEAARTRVWRNDEPVLRGRRVLRSGGGGSVGHTVALDVVRGDAVRIEKIVALHTSRDRGISEAGLDARLRVAEAGSFGELLVDHVEAWRQLWGRFDVTVEGARRAQLVLRLHAFHLLQTVSENTVGLDVGLPARGLHGEAYRGHVFWDELFILPLIDLRLPALAGSLLQYRWRRLEAARAAARREGHRGAMFPWQSASSGREEAPTLHLNPRSGRWLPDNSRLQRHIDVAVAYNMWHHVQATGDEAFLRVVAGPVMLELARFWASLATRRPSDHRFEIRGVMGPDEYHDAYPGASRPGLDNNAYTNVMVAWTMVRALELLSMLAPKDRADVTRQLRLTGRELSRWEELSRLVVVPFHDGVISQFEGYGDLLELDWTRYVERYGDIQRLDRILEAEGDTTNRYKVSKQADVLMLFYLLQPGEVKELFERLGYPFDPEVDVHRNIDYYLRRTSHGSTLSRVVHAWVLARFDRRRSWEQFSLALDSDVADVQGGTTAEGIHLGAMAGTIDLIQRCYGGVEVLNGEVSVRPWMPRGLAAVSFPLYVKGRRADIRVTPGGVRVAVEAGGGLGSDRPITFRIGGERVDLLPGAMLERSLPAGSEAGAAAGPSA